VRAVKLKALFVLKETHYESKLSSPLIEAASFFNFLSKLEKIQRIAGKGAKNYFFTKLL
jgi:hypothetical protein